MSEVLRVGEVAAAADVHPETLRYYERRGLLDRPDRSYGGHRLYPAATVTRLRTIKAAQRLGFTLAEVADLLDASAPHLHPPSGSGMHDRAIKKLAEVDQKIADLQTIREGLRTAIAAGCDDLTECAQNPACPVPFTPAH